MKYKSIACIYHYLLPDLRQSHSLFIKSVPVGSYSYWIYSFYSYAAKDLT